MPLSNNLLPLLCLLLEDDFLLLPELFREELVVVTTEDAKDILRSISGCKWIGTLVISPLSNIEINLSYVGGGFKWSLSVRPTEVRSTFEYDGGNSRLEPVDNFRANAATWLPRVWSWKKVFFFFKKNYYLLLFHIISTKYLGKILELKMFFKR